MSMLFKTHMRINGKDVVHLGILISPEVAKLHGKLVPKIFFSMISEYLNASEPAMLDWTFKRYNLEIICGRTPAELQIFLDAADAISESIGH